MTPERAREAARICEAAFDRPALERGAFVVEECAGDEALRREVESLLGQLSKADEFLQRPALEVAAAQALAPHALVVGQQVGPYQIQGRLGAGGMGEVYRARDTRLGREVAIKILPREFTADPDRLARFEREARVLASLNHPNIATIHGVEEADGVKALVLELVPGETLADRIARTKRRGLPVAEALAISRQIADALDTAHEKGIIHRDLKPANIKITPDGLVKVLDFGLAKLQPAEGGADGSQAPTATFGGTREGLIVGTPAYMSPEQARGQSVDARADIWAFGCVLLEMLTGRQPFATESVADTLAAVLTREPDWTRLPATLPSTIRALLAGCLEKDRRLRVGDASTLLFVLDKLSTERSPDSSAAKRGSSVKAVAAAVVVSVFIAGATGAWLARRTASQSPRPLSRFEIVPASPKPLKIGGFDRDLAISPDGRHVAYVSQQSPMQLIVRHLDALESVSVATVTANTNPVSVFFSPDSASVGFFDGSVLKRVSTTGGPSAVIGTVPGLARGASWGTDGTIVLATGRLDTGLFSVPAGGGEPRVLTKPDPKQGEGDHVFPSWLPDGVGVIFTILSADQRRDQDRIAVFDPKTGRYKTVIRGASYAQYVDDGYLVYASAGSLFAVRFDLGRLEAIGSPTVVVQHVNSAFDGAVDFAISATGTLAYVPEPAAPRRSLVWVDRKGGEEAIPAPAHAYTYPRLSPDGTRVAVDARDEDNDIWIWNFGRETLTRFTYGPEPEHYPLWTPDGRYLLFASWRPLPNGAIYRRLADGSGEPEPLFMLENRFQWPTSLSPDGSTVVIERDTAQGYDVGTEHLPTSRDVSARALNVQYVLATPNSEALNGAMSPDGRWLAFQSNTSRQIGQYEIYVVPFPNVIAGRWQISVDGGTKPLWARNGRELFFMRNGRVMSAAIQTSGTTLVAAKPVTVLDRAYFSTASDRVLGGYTMGRTYDVSPDGQRFLMIKEDPNERAPAGMVIVLNWIDELKRLVPIR